MPGYFSAPRMRLPSRLRLGENSPVNKYAGALLMVFMLVTLYPTFLLPGIESLQCGEAWADDYVAWLGPDGEANTADDVGTQPPCDSGHLPTAYGNLSKLMPLLVLLPFLMLIFRQAGNPSSLASMLLALLLREIVPGDGTMDWAIMAIGVVGAVIPMPMGGLLASLAHAGAVALWPTFVLAYVASAQSASSFVGGAVDWTFEFLVWIALFAVLTLIPLRWQARRGEEL